MEYRLIFLFALVFASPLSGSDNVIVQRTNFKINQQQQLIDYSRQNLSEIPNSAAFPIGTGKIDLSSNSIRRVKNFTFYSVRLLKILDLSNNNIVHLEPMAFAGLGRLESLNLSFNWFELDSKIFNPTLFQPLIKLSTLRLQGLNRTSYPVWKGIDKGLSKLSNLEKLFMDFPLKFTFDDGFAMLTNLETISNDHLRYQEGCYLELTNDTFNVFANSDIKELRLNHHICKLDTGTFLPLRGLSILDLSNNPIGLASALESLYGLQNRRMEEINFSNVNKVAVYMPSNFMVLKHQTIYLKTICVRSIDLYDNSINYLEQDGHTSTLTRSDCLEVLKISSKGMVSRKSVLKEVSMYHFIKHADVSGFAHVHAVGQDKPGRFSSPPSRFNKMKSPHYGASLLTLNISRNVYMDANNYCWLSWNFPNLQALDASYTNLDIYRYKQCDPPSFLNNLLHLNISGLSFDYLYESLANFPSLQRLTLKNTPNIHTIIGDSSRTGDGLHYLRGLQEIDLSGNKLTGLNRNIFINNTNLRSIILSNNKLQRVPLAIIQMENISRLDLSENAFTHMNAEKMSRFEHFSAGQPRFRLVLASNPFQCTCETLDFINWVYRNKRYLDLDGNYTCVLSSGRRVDLARFESMITDVSVSCISQTWLIVSMVGLVVVLLLFSQCYIVYRYRTNLRYWLYTKLKPPVEMLVQQEYVYDAFVAYVEENYAWIYNDVRGILENGTEALKLCFHNRDFTPGKPIHENIVDKMRQSRKIILAISIEFINSIYGPLEIEYAGMKSLEVGREDVIICILLEDIPVREMPKPLRNLWHKITFLKWPEDPREQPCFWEQLRSAITDSRM